MIININYFLYLDFKRGFCSIDNGSQCGIDIDSNFWGGLWEIYNDSPIGDIDQSCGRYNIYHIT